MAWNCGCLKKLPDFSPYLWPIIQAECSGQAQACQMACNQQTHQPGRPNCATLCNEYYVCDSPNAPPSYLKTDTATDIPDYTAKNITRPSSQPQLPPANQSQQSSDSNTLVSIVWSLIGLSILCTIASN
ncbi:hypothetical protein BDF14DRAFT_1719977 [Spinellus fusiger]|nr:hypothetical protein BDF14DRAFT_1719977 [Spinellus fusiger]